MFRLLGVAVVYSFAVSGVASAATINVSDGTPADFSKGYTSRNVASDELISPDPWPDGGAVTTAKVSIGHRAIIDVAFRGASEDAWSVDFGDGRSFSSDSVAGDSIKGLSSSSFLAIFFSNEATGVPLTDPSVAVQLFGNTLEIGWDGTSSEKDYGYLRLVATVTAVPIPVGLPMLTGAILALFALRRTPVG
jgi:hypothetical protein